MRTVIRLLVALSCVVASLASAQAEKRVALIIGNASYAHIAHLPNVRNDAAAMFELLRSADFGEIDVVHNLGVDQLRRAIKMFAGKATDADVAVLYYAGHGIEVGQTNYLIPVDARLATDFDVEDETVPLDRVLQAMEPARRLRLVILDACRENPFLKSMKRTVATRSVGRGLARVEPSAANTLIAFSTKPNAVAEDGKGPNSPFTAALVKHLLTPGLDLRALGKVRDEVLAATGGRQEPYVTSSLGGEVVAIVPGAPGASPASAERPRLELLLEAERAGILSERLKELLDEARRRKLVPPPLPAPAPVQPQKQARYEITGPDGKRYEVTAPDDVGEAETLAWFKREVAGALPKGATVISVGAFRVRAVMPLTAVEERALRPKDSFKECTECPDMVVLPAGSFTMGSPESEEGREPADKGSESPQHRVTIARPFAVGKFEVTFAEWDDCVAGGGCTYVPKDFGSGRGKRPVVNVSWNDITGQYLPWLNRKTGKTYRLLTEAEWEYAARAETRTPYAFGNKITRKQAQYSEGDSGSAGGAVEVASFPANAFGLHDIHGNVWEWVQDCWHGSYDGAPSDGSAWTGSRAWARVTGASCDNHVLRGGSWFLQAPNVRSANRWAVIVPGFRNFDIGFRVARTLN